MNLHFKVSDLLDILQEIHDDGYEYVNLIELENDPVTNSPSALGFYACHEFGTIDYDSVDSVDIDEVDILSSTNNFRASDITMYCLNLFPQLKFESNENVKLNQQRASHLLASITTGYKKFSNDELLLIYESLLNVKNYISHNLDEFKNHRYTISKITDEIEKVKDALNRIGTSIQ